MGPGRPGRADRQPCRTRRGRPPSPPREVPAGQGRRLRRQLHGRRDRHPRRRRVRGQRPYVSDPPRNADLRRRHREGGAHLARSGSLPADAAALLDRRAHEPVHLHVDRHGRRGRTAGLPSGPARQRPHRGAGRRGRPPGAALHPLLRLPQCLPGVRAGGRPCVRIGLPGPDRRDPEPPAARHRERDRCLPAVCVIAVRRLLRGVPGRHRHSRSPCPSAGEGRGPRRQRTSPGEGRDQGGGVGPRPP